MQDQLVPLSLNITISQLRVRNGNIWHFTNPNKSSLHHTKTRCDHPYMDLTSVEQTQPALSPALVRAVCVRVAVAFLIGWVHARAAKHLSPRGYMRCPCDTVFSLFRSKHLKSCGSCAAPRQSVLQKAQAQQ